MSTYYASLADAYAYGLQLMDALFTKHELAGGLIFKSKKSDKPGLDHDQVQKLMSKSIDVLLM